MTPKMNLKPFAPKRVAAAILTLISLPALAFSEGLEWKQVAQRFETDFDDETVTAVYEFTNTSEESISIAETKASCGCTVPSLQKYDYAPGESGELTAVFTIGSRQGEQHKLINVHTESEGGESAFYELKLEVDIPVPVTLKPRVRFWTVSQEAETQTIDITLHEKKPMAITGLARKDPDLPEHFDYQIETVEPNYKYTLRITPKDPSSKAREVFVLQTEDAAAQDLLDKFPVYAYIR